MSSERRDAFWKEFPGLVWSNRKASDSVMIMAALTHPRFHEILAICEEFGFERVMEEWRLLQAEGMSARLVEMVSPMLTNLAVRFKYVTGADQQRMAGTLC